MTISKFQKLILTWHKKNKRDMPWRETRDPYKILVSEIMLQQTQVTRVLPKYKEFLKEFPTLNSLAKTSDKKHLYVWAGLGYWKRALSLKKTAQIIQKEYKGKFPKEPSLLIKLPGVGPYTAGAVACFAFLNKDAFLDTNIRRVYLYFFFPKQKNVPDKEVLKIVQKTIWEKNPREWYYALLDYGSIVLKGKKINRQSKHYTKQSKFEGSFRSFRTKTIRFLLSQPQGKATKKRVESFLTHELQKRKSSYSIDDITKALLKNNLIKKSQRSYFL